MTRRQRKPVVARVIEDPHIGWFNYHVTRGFVLALGDHLIGERAPNHLHLNSIARLELVDSVERRTPSGAMPGDRGIAGQPRQRSRRVVTRPLLQRSLLDALDDELLDIDGRDR